MRNLISMIAISLLFVSSAWGQDDNSQDNSSPKVDEYAVDVENSDIRLLMYRAGALSRMGHNHIVSVGQVTGRVRVYADLEQSNFELLIPVADLIVDDPRVRREEGDQFLSVPSEGDIAGTRRNMLGKRLLNGKIYPTVKVTGTGPRTNGSEPELILAIEIHDRVVEILVPVSLHLEDEVLEATGTFPLSHSDLGLRPFSAILGALRVADEMELKYRVRAKRVPEGE